MHRDARQDLRFGTTRPVSGSDLTAFWFDVVMTRACGDSPGWSGHDSRRGWTATYRRTPNGRRWDRTARASRLIRGVAGATIGCFWRRCHGPRAPAARGAICRSGSATGARRFDGSATGVLPMSFKRILEALGDEPELGIRHGRRDDRRGPSPRAGREETASCLFGRLPHPPADRSVNAPDQRQISFPRSNRKERRMASPGTDRVR